MKRYLLERLKICLFIFTNNRTLAEILQGIQANINRQNVSLINVHRSTFWEDTCHQLGGKKFSPNNRLSVKFVNNEGESEGAVDLGGPTREFLTLAVKAANEESGIFIGPPECRSLFPNTTGMCLSFTYMSILLQVEMKPPF